METKTQFGIGSIAKHSPKWLVPAFASAIIVIGVASFLITGDPGIPDPTKVRINHYLTGFTMLISGLAPLFGVDLKPKK